MYAVNVEATATKIYHNCFHLLNKLSKHEFIFLMFLLQEMDGENRIVNNDELRYKFNRLTGEDFKDQTFHKWFLNIMAAELITRSKSKRGNYQLQPLYFKNTVDGKNDPREKLLRKNMEKPLEHEIAKARAISLSRKGNAER